MIPDPISSSARLCVYATAHVKELHISARTGYNMDTWFAKFSREARLQQVGKYPSPPNEAMNAATCLKQPASPGPNI